MTAPTLKGINFLGQGFDITVVDPLSIDSSAKYRNIVDFTVCGFVDTPDGSYSVPNICDYKGIFSLDSQTQTSTITCGHDFTREMRGVVSISGGVPSIFDFSGSVTYNDIETLTKSSTEICVFARVCQKNHGLSLRLDDAKLNLAASFVDAVRALPLPQADEEVDTFLEPYRQLIDKFGTHFASEIVLGGLAWQRLSTVVAKTGIDRQTELKLKTDASLVLDKVKGGASIDVATKEAEKVDASAKYERTELYFRGGMTPSLNELQAQWLQTLDDRPAVVSATLTRVSEVLTDALVPQCKGIASKQGLLNAAIDAWIEDGNGNPDVVLRYGDRVVVYLHSSALPDGAPIAPDMGVVITGSGGSAVVASPSGTPPLVELSFAPFGQTLDLSARTGEPILYGDLVQLRGSVAGTEYNVRALGGFGTTNGQPHPLLFAPFNRDPRYTQTKLLYRDATGAASAPAGRMIRQSDRVVLSIVGDHIMEGPDVWGFVQLRANGATTVSQSDDDHSQYGSLVWLGPASVEIGPGSGGPMRRGD